MDHTSRHRWQRHLTRSLAGVAISVALFAPILPIDFIKNEFFRKGIRPTSAIILVTPGASGTNTGDGCSLVEAIINANYDDTSGSPECTAGSGDDTIQLPDSATLTYATPFGSPAALPTITTTLTIAGNGSTIQRTGISEFPLLRIESGSLRLEQATVTGGLTDMPGGGIAVYDGTLTLTNSLISNNSATYGGGIALRDGSVATITNSTVSSNSASFGGGIDIEESVGTLTDVTVTTNQGGGMSVVRSYITISNSTVSMNNGGIGCGIALFDTTAFIRNSTLSNNSGLEGGGIAIFPFSQVFMSYNTISGNSISSNGGGIYVYVYDEPTIVELESNLISGNRAFYGNEIFIPVQITFSASGNAIGDNGETNEEAIYPPRPIADGNNITFTSDGEEPTALEAILAPLADNGGRTHTHALILGSPAIDRLNAGQSTDQRGVNRPLEGDGNTSSYEYDIGAFEFDGLPQPTPTPTSTVMPPTATPTSTITPTSTPVIYKLYLPIIQVRAGE